MIRKALEYVADLRAASQEIITKEINGETYIKGECKRIPTNKAERMDLSTLKSTVDYIRNCIETSKFEYPFIVNVEHDRVMVYSGLNDRLERNEIICTVPLLPRIHFNQWLDMESFVIQLKTCFEETDNLKKLVSIVSTITDESKVSMKDDGFGLSITQVQGTAIKSEKSFDLNPIVRLTPYRTFTELMQPESRFLLRVRDGGQMALYEADGGMWKLDAQVNISIYLRNQLKEEIANGTVLVVG